MKYEREITVEVDTSLEELVSILEANNYHLVEIYDLNDIYMVNKNDRDLTDYLELLNRCILLRHLIEKDTEKKMIVYKHKEYDEEGNIIKQGKIKCFTDDLDKAKELFEALNFEELIKIFDHTLVYSNGKDELVVQSVNGKHIYIELEDDGKYESEEDMKKVIHDAKIPIKKDNYFMKKAQIELIEKYGRNDI